MVCGKVSVCITVCSHKGDCESKMKGTQGDGECEDVENMRVKLPSVCSHKEDCESKMKWAPGRW